MNTSEFGMLNWTLPARHYLATGRDEFLIDTIEACPDDRIKNFLRDLTAMQLRMICPELPHDLIASLQSQGRDAEAVTVYLLTIRTTAFAAESVERMSPSARRFSEDACYCGLKQSHRVGFPQGIVAFAGTLGVMYLKEEMYLKEDKAEWATSRLKVAQIACTKLMSDYPNLYIDENKRIAYNLQQAMNLVRRLDVGDVVTGTTEPGSISREIDESGKSEVDVIIRLIRHPLENIETLVGELDRASDSFYSVDHSHLHFEYEIGLPPPSRKAGREIWRESEAPEMEAGLEEEHFESEAATDLDDRMDMEDGVHEYREASQQQEMDRDHPESSATTLARPESEPIIDESPSLDQAAPSVSDETGKANFTVWYGTNRLPLDLTEIQKGFGSDLSKKIHYGRCIVFIPKSHEPGSVGSKFLKRIWCRIKSRFKWTDDRLRLKRIHELEEDRYWSSIQSTIRRFDQRKRHALVFIHGYHVSFEEAAKRAAQIGFDLKIPAVTAFFSWPSKGTLFSYPHDESIIGDSEEAITDFLVKFATKSGADQVHIIAHSMGNRGLVRAMQRIHAGAAQRTNVKFGQIILAAPDISVGLFEDLARIYPKFAQRTTLYASPADLAVRMSQKLHKNYRVGFPPPVTIVPGIDTILVPRFKLLGLGHAYFAQAKPLLHDIHSLMRNNDPPDVRIFTESRQTDAGEMFWEIL